MQEMTLNGQALSPEALLSAVEQIIATGQHPQHDALVALSHSLSSYIEYQQRADEEKRRVEQQLTVIKF